MLDTRRDHDSDPIGAARPGRVQRSPAGVKKPTIAARSEVLPEDCISQSHDLQCWVGILCSASHGSFSAHPARSCAWLRARPGSVERSGYGDRRPGGGNGHDRCTRVRNADRGGLFPISPPWKPCGGARIQSGEPAHALSAVRLGLGLPAGDRHGGGGAHPWSCGTRKAAQDPAPARAHATLRPDRGPGRRGHACELSPALFATPRCRRNRPGRDHGGADPRRRPAGIDVYALQHQPRMWDGAANPFAETGEPEASDAYGLMLGPDADATVRRVFSADARKKLRSKEKRLVEAKGALAYRRAETPRGGPVSGGVLCQQGFAVCRDGASPTPTRPSRSDNSSPRLPPVPTRRWRSTPCAWPRAGVCSRTFGGAVSEHRFSGMMTAFDPDPEIARSARATCCCSISSATRPQGAAGASISASARPATKRASATRRSGWSRRSCR